MSRNPLQLLRLKRYEDPRGWFAETYNRETFLAHGIDCVFVQDNHSLSRLPFTVRGLHFQLPPRAQAKLVRCVSGSIWDVAVDIRAESPTYGKWTGAELSAENGRQLFLPIGFAHGFVTLEPDTEVVYKCSDTYAPEHDSGILWSDPLLAIDWPIPANADVALSDKDRRQRSFAEFSGPFSYNGCPLKPLD
jgi:dTDP-4-dehydrorhamnose 3,5-epimerase